ncbi:MurR/RpiR family transcriptional regulator [Parasedimentitalea maritima]|uniref:SIS domain-containing protein n=1 Tax=Parasedimentitalea maritima TaxID=2578117 RepID=A0A6A4RBI9_9RHOB|nr:MurR/RpiR family transcriptional regulator [Zongyanglinia marina]KAE9627273.1 SIS domain-containing protein [Zongyanglinia marina]
MTKTDAPKTTEEFQEKLVEITDQLPKRLRQCADYIARNTDIIAVSTVADLSKGAGVQPSAFMRFCQLMGFSGFSQMQRVFRESQTYRRPDYATRLENLRAGGDESPSALLAEFVDAGRASLENLAQSIEPATLESAVQAISKAPMVHIVGLSRAFPVATYLAYAFEKMDVPAMLHGKLGNLDHRHAVRPDDVLIAITFAPYTQETLSLAAFAHTQGTKIIAITDAINSPLHPLNAIPLIVSEADVGAFRALTAPLSLAVTLAVAAGSRRANPET